MKILLFLVLLSSIVCSQGWNGFPKFNGFSRDATQTVSDTAPPDTFDTVPQLARHGVDSLDIDFNPSEIDSADWKDLTYSYYYADMTVGQTGTFTGVIPKASLLSDSTLTWSLSWLNYDYENGSFNPYVYTQRDTVDTLNLTLALRDSSNNSNTMAVIRFPLYRNIEDRLVIDSVWFSDHYDSLYWRTLPSGFNRVNNTPTGSPFEYHSMFGYSPQHDDFNITSEYAPTLTILLGDSIGGRPITVFLDAGDSVFVRYRWTGQYANQVIIYEQSFLRSQGYAVFPDTTDYTSPDSIAFDLALVDVNPQATFIPSSVDSADAKEVRLWYSYTGLQASDSVALDTLLIADLDPDSVINYTQLTVDPNVWIWGYTFDNYENKSGVHSDSIKVVADTTPPDMVGTIAVVVDSPLINIEIDETSAQSDSGDIQDYLGYYKYSALDEWTLLFVVTDIVDTNFQMTTSPGKGDSVFLKIAGRDTNLNITADANCLKDTVVLGTAIEYYALSDTTSFKDYDGFYLSRQTLRSDSVNTGDSIFVPIAQCDTSTSPDTARIPFFPPNDADSAWYWVRGKSGVELTLKSASIWHPARSAGGGGETYAFRWNGDHATDTSYADLRSGDASLDGNVTGTIEISSAYGEAGNGLRVTGANEYITWVMSGVDTINTDSGTIWFSIKTDASEDFTADGCFIESYISSNDKMNCVVRSSDEKLNFTFKGSGTEEGFASTSVVNTGNWVRCALSWDITTQKVAVYDDIADGWSVSVSSTYTKASTLLDDFTLGENATGSSFTHNIYIDNVYLVNGDYQAADPYTP